jgi:hypothetical protein
MFDGKTPLSPDEAKSAYSTFLMDLPRFEAALIRVVTEWPKSCEQFLTNASLNRIAWLGQAAMCMDTGVPCIYRAGFSAMTAACRDAANDLAEKYLAQWCRRHEDKNQEIRQGLDGQGLFNGYT